jgi:hypothetical protein
LWSSATKTPLKRRHKTYKQTCGRESFYTTTSFFTPVACARIDFGGHKKRGSGGGGEKKRISCLLREENLFNLGCVNTRMPHGQQGKL